MTLTNLTLTRRDRERQIGRVMAVQGLCRNYAADQVRERIYDARAYLAARAQRLSLPYGQYGALARLRERGGTSSAAEAYGPRADDGVRRVSLRWGSTPLAVLVELERLGYVQVDRHRPLVGPIGLTAHEGELRRPITIRITDAGRAALDRE